MTYKKMPLMVFSVLSLSVVVANVQAVTIKLGPIAPAVVDPEASLDGEADELTHPEKELSAGKKKSLSEVLADNKTTSGSSALKNQESPDSKSGNIYDSIDINKLQGEISRLQERIANEEAARGGKPLNEVNGGSWHLDSTKTLLENLTEWQQQASMITGKDVKLLWNAPGPGDFEVSYSFKGTWDQAFTELGHAIEKTPEWPIEISVNTRMYTVQVSAIRN